MIPCDICGALIQCSEWDTVNYVLLHREWHERHDGKIAGLEHERNQLAQLLEDVLGLKHDDEVQPRGRLMHLKVDYEPIHHDHTRRATILCVGKVSEDGKLTGWSFDCHGDTLLLTSDAGETTVGGYSQPELREIARAGR